MPKVDCEREEDDHHFKREEYLLGLHDLLSAGEPASKSRRL
jgi:hypothetical protein